MKIVHENITKINFKFDVIFYDILRTIFISCRWEHKKNDFYITKKYIRNVFSNIELPLEHNNMTLEYV